jgi:hypothetical protein
MRRSQVLATLFLAAVVSNPAAAITGRFVKDFEHPFVGLAVFYDATGEFIGRCSGSLLSPSLFLTAGHCIEGAASARVYFQQDAGVNYDPVTQIDPVTGYPESCLSQPCTTSSQLINYGYPAGFPNTRDAALLVLDDAIVLSEYGTLAAAGTLDELATRRGRQAINLTVSGYGLSYTNPAVTVSFRERLMASQQLVNLTSALTGGFNLQATNNPGIGGGSCFGDSGGPVFYGSPSSNLIVGITSFGLSANVCAGVDFAYRTDQAELIAWVLANVPAGETVTIVE